MRKICKMLIAVCIILSVIADAASACTGIYVGPAASADGTAFIARSSDNQAVWGNHITITPRVENKPGRTMQVDMNGKVFTKIPDTTYRYTATPFFSSVMKGVGIPNDATACTNEYGVAMTMAITAFANSAALKADPLKDAGLTENTAVDLVMCQSRSAREAVKVLASIVDRYGSSECNIALIADQKEVWYMEMYTGYQYAAVKLPEDKVSVFGNEFTLEYLSEYEESFTSKNLENLPEKHGFAVYGEKQELNLFQTYSGKEVAEDYCHMRTWIGHKVLAPSLYKDDYKLDAMYPLCFKPDKKVTLQDVCAIMRNRYEGTPYDPDQTGRIDMRVIGTDTAMSVHILQVYRDMPADMACVTWESSGPAIYGVFVPVSNASLSLSEVYGKNQPASEFGHFDSENYPYYAFKELATLCVGHDSYKAYGAPVKEYWNRVEKNMSAGMQKVLKKASKMKDKNAAADYITKYCNRMQTQAFMDAKEILNKLIWRQAADSNTMKLGRNPETGELLNTPRVLKPLEIDSDASVYTLKP